MATASATASGSGSGSSSRVDMDDYSVPKPSRIKLKETDQERAKRLYDQEARRQKRKSHLISRANGYALSPPPTTSSGSRVGRSESITPPRIPVSGTGTRHQDAVLGDREEERDRMAYLEAEELGRLESDPFGDYSVSDVHVHIPKRYRPAPASPPFTSTSTSTRGGLGSASQSRTGTGSIPSMNGMNEDEYTTYIREGMERLRNITEQKERDELKRQREKVAEERLRREEAEEKRREERRRKRREERAKAQQSDTHHPHAQANPNAHEHAHGRPRHYVNVDEESVVDLVRDSKSLERTRYINLWQSLAGLGGEVQQVEMRYKDIPWPIYGGKSLDKQNIYMFLSDLSSDPTTTNNNSNASSARIGGGGGGNGAKDREKKILRDAIRIFHPDRFFGRFLDRVRASDRDRVKEGVEICSRVINALAAENAAR